MKWLILLAALLVPFALCQPTKLIFPTCVNTCLGNSSHPCSPDSLPAFISCLDASCSATSAFSRYSITYSPRVEYSCQQSYVTGDENAPAQVTISGLGGCATSPYDFQSFIAAAPNNSALASICHMDLYPEPYCVGHPTMLSLSGAYERCYFHGGRSARLDCTTDQDDTTTFRYVEEICGASVVSRWLNSTSMSNYNSSSSSPGYGSNYTNGTDAAPFIFPGLMPYTSSGNEKKNDARIAALFALVAAIAML